MEGDSKPAARRYNAFLSYSTDPDYAVVRKTESFLESFHKLKTPGDLLLSELKICVDGSDFSSKRVRQKEGEDAVRNLIDDYLGQSDELLVFCSGNSRVSPWVDHEVRWFLEHRGPDAIHLVVTEGADPGAQADEVFSPTVQQAGLHQKPWYDFREARGKTASNWRKVKNFDDERTRLAADLNGVSAGEIQPIWYRQQRRALRRRIMISALALLLIVISAAAAGYWGILAKKEKGLKLVSDAYQILYRDPSRAVIKAYRGRQLVPGAASEAALKTAFKVAVLHHYNRRENSRITGSGPSYLASRWKQGGVFTEDSPDGRHRLVVTERGEDGATPPGEVYLLNNETLKLTKLEPCIESKTRVEDVAFDQTSSHIFVTRYFNLSVYSTIGECVGGYRFSRFTKSPVHLVAGYFADGYVLGSETKGGLWLVKPQPDKAGASREEAITLQREFQGDPAMSAAISPDRRKAAIVFESGRAAVLEIRKKESVMHDLVKQAALYAGFYPGSDHRVITTGTDGVVRIWQLDGGEAKEISKIAVSDTALDWVTLSEDEQYMLAVGANQTLYIIDIEKETLLSAIHYADEIDWAAARAVTGKTQSVPLTYDRRPPEIKALDDPDLRVADVLDVSGESWLLVEDDKPDYMTGAIPYRVQGTEAYRYPAFSNNVTRIQKWEDLYWLKQWTTGSGPLYRFGEKGLQILPGKNVWATDILRKGDTIWFASSKGLYKFSQDQLTRVSAETLQVYGLYEIQGRIYVASNRGAYVLEKGMLVRLTDPFLEIREIKLVGGNVWITTKSHASAGASGPLYLQQGYFSTCVGDTDWQVPDIFEVDHRIWIPTSEDLYAYDHGRLKAVSGLKHRVTAVKKKADRLVLATRNPGLFQTPATEYALDPATLTATALEVESYNWKPYGSDYLAVKPGGTPMAPKPPVVLRREGERQAVLDLDGAAVNSIAQVNGLAWIATDRGIYRLENAKAVKVEGLDGPVQTIMAGKDETWLLAGRTVIRLSGDSRHKFDLGAYRARELKDVDGTKWILTTADGDRRGPAYRFKNARLEQISGPPGGVNDVVLINGHVWLTTKNGTKAGPLYKMDN